MDTGPVVVRGSIGGYDADISAAGAYGLAWVTETASVSSISTFPVVVLVKSRDTTEVSNAFPEPIPLAAVISRILPVISVAPPSIIET